MEVEHLRKSEDLLRRTEVERKNIIQEWKELRRFLREQEKCMLRSLEELNRGIIVRRGEGISRDHGKMSNLGEDTEGNQRRFAQQSTEGTNNRKNGAFPKLDGGFVELERRINHFSEKRTVLQEFLLTFKEILELEVGHNPGPFFLSGCRGRSSFYTAFLHSCRKPGGKMALLELAQEPVSFEEVAVRFTEGEWSLLDPYQRALYRDVMQENYENITSLVLSLADLDQNSRLEEREEETFLILHSQGSVEENNQKVTNTVHDEQGNINEKERSLFPGTSEKDVPQDTPLRKEKELQDHNGEDVSQVRRRSERQRKAEPNSRQEKPLPSKNDGQLTGENPVQRKICKGRKQKPCPKCGKLFSQSILLLKHKKTHTRMNPYQCSECGKVFSKSTHLKKHQRTHKREKRFGCSDCGKVFHRKSHLSSHRGIHTGLRPYQCSACGKSFRRGPDFRRHQKIHTGEKLHKCLDCGKSFGLNSSLIKHERVHTGEKPYKCLDCKKSFSQRSHLIVHKRTHLQDRPYKCSFCSSSFTQKVHLTSHERTHTGEKPFKCSDCGKSFKLNSARMKHERSHGGSLNAQTTRKVSAGTPTLCQPARSTRRLNFQNVQRLEKAAA